MRRTFGVFIIGKPLGPGVLFAGVMRRAIRDLWNRNKKKRVIITTTKTKTNGGDFSRALFSFRFSCVYYSFFPPSLPRVPPPPPSGRSMRFVSDRHLEIARFSKHCDAQPTTPQRRSRIFTRIFNIFYSVFGARGGRRTIGIS